MHIIRNKDAYSSEGGAEIPFFQNFWDSFTFDSIAWTRTKFCMQYTYFERWHWYNFAGHNLLRSTAVRIFSEFFEKHRSCVLLDEIAQKIICKIYSIRNNNYAV